MALKTKSTYPRQGKKLPTKKLPHKYRSYLNEIRPTWKKNPDMVEAMITDMLEKKYTYLLERLSAMEFIEKFMDIHQAKIMKVRPEKYAEVRYWAFYTKLAYMIDVYNWIRLKTYEHKFWINKELQLDYLNIEIEKYERKIRMKFDNNEEQIAKYQIYKLLKIGEFPSLSKYRIQDIARVFADLDYLDFLKSERKELLDEQEITSIKVPVELKIGNDSQENFIHIQIPDDFFKNIINQTTDKNPLSTALPSQTRIPPPKLYTRIETSEIMGVSLYTIDTLTKEGTLKCHRIGKTNMKRYLWENIKAALEVVEMRFNKRFRG